MPLSPRARTYLPGDIIHKEVPFVKILPREVKDEFCESCYFRSSYLRFCKQCLAVKYCGKVCQRKDWSIHRLECKDMINLPTGKGVDIVRLLGRVIHKIKGKDWKSFKTTVLGTEVSFDDIDSHYKDMTENPILNLLYKELQEHTRKFIGVGNTPKDIDMLKIIGKVIYNSFLNDEKESPVICFFLGMSVFKQQCVPNSSFMVIRNNLKVWANKKIVKSSEKISVSYRRIFDADSFILKEINDQKCNCSDCSLPYGESMLSRILDDKKAFSVISLTKNFLKVAAILVKCGMEFAVKEYADTILETHSGVLGRTNLLHLKLLGFRYLNIGGGPVIEVERNLKELESIMRSMFGEFSAEMLVIYDTLAELYLDLGFVALAISYLCKVKKIKDPWSEN